MAGPPRPARPAAEPGPARPARRQGQTRPTERRDRHGPPGSQGQTRPAAPERTALIVACGLGDDAEEVSRRGYRVTAFDLVPAAIEHCRERFPDSAVSYQVADLFRLPAGWRRAFDLVVEIRTLQSLPVTQRADAAAAVAGTVRPGGRLFVHGLGREDGDPPGSRPWPLSRRELGAFTAAGLRETEWIDDATGSTSGRRTFTAVYARP